MSNGRFGSTNGLAAWLSNTISQVLPSGGDFATARGADAARRAGAIVDDDGGAEPLLQHRLHQPGDHVGRSAGRIGHHELDGCAGRPVFRPRDEGRAPAAPAAPMMTVRLVNFDIVSSPFGRLSRYGLPNI